MDSGALAAEMHMAASSLYSIRFWRLSGEHSDKMKLAKNVWSNGSSCCSCLAVLVFSGFPLKWLLPLRIRWYNNHVTFIIYSGHAVSWYIYDHVQATLTLLLTASGIGETMMDFSARNTMHEHEIRESAHRDYHIHVMNRVPIHEYGSNVCLHGLLLKTIRLESVHYYPLSRWKIIHLVTSIHLSVCVHSPAWR